MKTTTTASIVGIAAIVLSLALSSVFIANQASAARETTCTNGGGHEKTCNSPPAKCVVVKAGEGKGSGETKSDTCA